MRKPIYFILFASLLVLLSCKGQTNARNQTGSSRLAEKTKSVGGGWDGCELMCLGMPTKLSLSVIKPGWTKA
jgi:protocatechuate 3,4-dioxygenase beta subunit